MNQQLQVLAIDDDLTARKALIQLFANCDGGRKFTLTVRASLEAAAGDSPDAILLDLVLGSSGLAGAETVREVARRWPGVPIVVLTGFPVNGERDEILAAGACSILEKIPTMTMQGFPVVLRALRRAWGQRTNTGGEVAATQAIKRAEAQPLLRSVRAWMLALGLLPSGAVGGWHYLDHRHGDDDSRAVQALQVAHETAIKKQEAVDLQIQHLTDSLLNITTDLKRIEESAAMATTSAAQTSRDVAALTSRLDQMRQDALTKALQELVRKKDPVDEDKPNRRRLPP